MDKTCSRCGNFNAYYEKAYACFLRTKCGNCRKKNITVNKKDCCEDWVGKRARRRNKEEVVKELKGAMLSINAVRLILEEENEE